MTVTAVIPTKNRPRLLTGIVERLLAQTAPIDELIVVQEGIDPAEGGVPQLVRIGQEHFDQAALRVRPPHHGASGEAGWPQSPHRVSCVAARAVRWRRSLTIAHPRRSRQANWSIGTSADTPTPHKHPINPVCFAPESN